MSRPVSLLFLAVLACVNCDYSALSTRVGEHVVYHWRAHEHMLCEGSVNHTDDFVELVAAYYGLDLDSNGPSIDYFVAVDDIGLSVCPGRDREECARATPTASNKWLTMVFAKRPNHTHELAHAVFSVRYNGIPTFLDEGFAQRWESVVLGGQVLTTQPLSLDEAQLRDRLNRWTALDDPADYAEAFSWFAAMEVTYGPAKMAELMQNLGKFSSADDVDDALRETLGISLGESVTLAANQPPLTFDDPTCQLDGIPTMEWEGTPMTLDRTDATCEDADVANRGSRVITVFRLEFPEEPVAVRVSVIGERNAFLRLDPCHGEPSSDGRYPDVFFATDPPSSSESDPLTGSYIVTLGGDFDSDGTVTLPLVTMEPTQP